MVKRIGSSIRKGRRKLVKPMQSSGKLSLTKYFNKFNQGDKVLLKAEPAVQGGMYHLRFHGKVGVVGEKQGRCYKVAIKDGAKQKTLLIHPVHLRKY